MRGENIFEHWRLGDLLESALPDFVLAFAFFTSIVYAVLGKRFEHQRSAITMSVCLGLALSVGLIWWEQSTGFSIKDLGPIAIGFAMIILALVMYQSIRLVGGTLAGGGIALGLSLLIALILGFKPPIDTQIINSIMVAALIFGLIAFLSHQRGHTSPVRFPQRYAKPEKTNSRRDMADLYRDRHLSDRITKRMRKVRKEADLLNEHPEEAADVLLQLKRMLPAEGYLTERMAQLRTKAHRIREGHIARLEETRHVFARLPTSAKKQAAADLAARYNQLIGIDTRLERLDSSVAQNEKRIRDLTQRAQQYTVQYDHPKLVDCLKAAEKLQHHNTRLFAIIDRTEGKLVNVAKTIAAKAKQVNAQ